MQNAVNNNQENQCKNLALDANLPMISDQHSADIQNAEVQNSAEIQNVKVQTSSDNENLGLKNGAEIYQFQDSKYIHLPISPDNTSLPKYKWEKMAKSELQQTNENNSYAFQYSNPNDEIHQGQKL